MRFNRLLLTLLTLVCGMFSLSVSAADNDGRAEYSSFVNNLGKQALAVITGNGSKEQKNQELEKLFSQNVDIDWIGRFVLGRYFKTATDEQKQLYMNNYRNFIVTHYTSNFSEFTDANFEVTRVTGADDGGHIVTMRIKRPQAEDIIVDYSVKKDAAGGLKVYDITVEGVSMITTQRSDFNAVIQEKGLDYLISQLARRASGEKL